MENRGPGGLSARTFDKGLFFLAVITFVKMIIVSFLQKRLRSLIRISCYHKLKVGKTTPHTAINNKWQVGQGAEY